MFRNVLIATDGSDLAEKAVQLGLAVAKDMSPKTAVVRATPVPSPYVAEGVVVTPPPEVREQIARAVRDPWQAILDTAKQKRCDLIVMASHGRSGFSAAFLGSETQKVLAQSTVPVLVCR